MRIRPLVLAFSLIAVASVAHATGNAAKGKVKFYTCLGCHGVEDATNVYPTYRIPRLAGQRAQYIVNALKEYKSGEREHPTMHAQASSLSEQDMADIAAYLSSLGKASTSSPKAAKQHASK